MAKLTLRERLELIEYHRKTGGTLLSTARKFNVTITTVHKTLKNKSDLVKRYNVEKDGRAKRFISCENAVLDSEVTKRYRLKQQNSGVTKYELKKIVNNVAKEYNIDLNRTGDWFKQFVKNNEVVTTSNVVGKKSGGTVNLKKKKVFPKHGRTGKGIVNYILKKTSYRQSLKFNKTEKLQSGCGQITSNSDKSVVQDNEAINASKETNLAEENIKTSVVQKNTVVSYEKNKSPNRCFVKSNFNLKNKSGVSRTKKELSARKNIEKKHRASNDITNPKNSSSNCLNTKISGKSIFKNKAKAKLLKSFDESHYEVGRIEPKKTDNLSTSLHNRDSKLRLDKAIPKTSDITDSNSDSKLNQISSNIEDNKTKLIAKNKTESQKLQNNRNKIPQIQNSRVLKMFDNGISEKHMMKKDVPKRNAVLHTLAKRVRNKKLWNKKTNIFLRSRQGKDIKKNCLGNKDDLNIRNNNNNNYYTDVLQEKKIIAENTIPENKRIDVFEFDDRVEDSMIMPAKILRRSTSKPPCKIEKSVLEKKLIGNEHFISRNSNTAGFLIDNCINSSERININKKLEKALVVNNMEDEKLIKPGFEQNVSIEFTPKKPRSKSRIVSKFINDKKTFLRTRQKPKITKKIKAGLLDKHDIVETTDVNKVKIDEQPNSFSKREEPTNNYDSGNCFNFETENNDNGGNDVDLEIADHFVAVEDENMLEIYCADKSQRSTEESVKIKPGTSDLICNASSPKIGIISNIQIVPGSPSKTEIAKISKRNSSELLEDDVPAAITTETDTWGPPSPSKQSFDPLNESWSNLFSESYSGLSTEELVSKINEIKFHYDPDVFKNVKIEVHAGCEDDLEQEMDEFEDEQQEMEDAPSSQGQPMPPPNQMQQPPNSMQNNYRPPMPPNNRAPAPRGPQPGGHRMPGGPRGPQMNQRAPGTRPRAPMVRPRGGDNRSAIERIFGKGSCECEEEPSVFSASDSEYKPGSSDESSSSGTQPVRGQVRPRMTGAQNNIRPTNQTSPAKRTDQNAALQAKKRKLDILTPSDKDDDDCQVICMQPKNTDGGLPQIESVQGAESVENSIMHLSDSITLSVRNPPPKPVASPVKSDAKAVANILATRGITVTASAKSKESHSPVKQAPALPTALSLNGAVSIVASKNAGTVSKNSSENLPTVDLTDDSISTKETTTPPKNRPGLPYRCDLCPAQYPNAMGLNKHRQTYHKTTSGMCEWGVPLINVKQPGILQKLSSLGINNYIPLTNAGPDQTYALPIINAKNPGNVTALGATQMLSLGPVRAIPKPGAHNPNNANKK